MIKRTIADFSRRAARRMRNDTTQAEALLWLRLRRVELEGTHFRRQVNIGPYIADFACMTRKLIVKIDGSQHGDADVAAYDHKRTLWFEAEGYRVMRFWNNEVTSQIRSVMDAIHRALTDTPPRLPPPGDPPPQGEGERS